MHNVEFYCNNLIEMTPHIFPENAIFPLKTIDFEGFQLKAPNDPHTILAECYGDYMMFPRTGIEHHGGEFGDLRRDRPIKSGINMDKVLEELKDMDRFFRE